MTTTANGTVDAPTVTDPPDENAQALEALEAEAKRAGVRLPRPKESRESYLLTIARNRGVIPQDAHVADRVGTVKTLLKRAGEDELAAGSPNGRALITAAAIFSRMRPEIAHLGELRATGRRGVHVAVAHLVQALREDPTHAQRLSPAETELLRFYASDELRHVVDGLQAALEAALARVREAAEAEAQRPIYSDLIPREPPVEESRYSFEDTRGPQSGDAPLAWPDRAEPKTVPTPSHLRHSRGW